MSFIMGQLGVFLETLRNTPEGDSNLLANSSILCTTELSEGKVNSNDEFPVLFRVRGGSRDGCHRRAVRVRPRRLHAVAPPRLADPSARKDARTGPGSPLPDDPPDAAPTPAACAAADGTGDSDLDGYGDGPGCAAPDCDDTNGAIHPGAFEACNGVDENCDGAIEEGLAQSACGTGACRTVVENCLEGRPQARVACPRPPRQRPATGSMTTVTARWMKRPA